MKIASYLHRGIPSFGIVKDDHVLDAADATGLMSLLGDPDFVAKLDRRIPSFKALAMSDIEFLPTIPAPEKIFCVGMNYLSHIKENNLEIPKFPWIFLRVASAQVGHGVPLLRPKVSEQLDFEGELAVIIGRGGRHIPTGSAMDHVAGYSCFNEGSVRDWQLRTTQYDVGKNFYHSGSFGPWMVTADEISDSKQMKLETRLNGAVMQTATLDDLVFGVADLISYLSDVTLLAPGDVIVTGTPGGIGLYRKPPVFMKAGDVVEVDIDRIGVLSNPIADEI